MGAQYKSLPQQSPVLSALPESELTYRERRPHQRIIPIVIVLLVLSNILSLAWPYRNQHKENIPSDFARVNEFDTVWKRFWWNTAYSTSNHTDNDALWDAILPSHGIVAVDKQWAAEKHWPQSLSVPGDDSKMAYLLEAYHQLHCLRILRKTFWEAVDGRPFTYHPGAHMEHCFDTLRQSVQCNADDTPLYSWGKFTAGDGQLHRCRDWNQLRDWATENTACFRDSVEGIPLRDHFGYCDDGADGLGEIDEGVGKN